MHKKHKIILSTILFILIATVAIGAYYQYARNSWAVKFTQFMPSYMPYGANEKNKSIDIWRTKNPNPFIYERIFTINYDGHSISLIGQEFAGEIKDWGGCKANANTKCETITTPNRQKYETATVVSTINGQVTGQRATLFKGNTYIWIDSKTDLSRLEWDKIIDSFVPVSYKKITTKHYSYGP